jgi:hypothetical protein
VQAGNLTELFWRHRGTQQVIEEIAAKPIAA